MLDRQTEALYYPRPLLQLDAIESVLCLAPHPDDEVFGCGGLLTQLAGGRCRIDTLILSRGESGGAGSAQQTAAIREQESIRAAQVLGLPTPRFQDFVDRELSYGEPLIGVLVDALNELKPQYLLLPSLSEPHPDHQAVALAGMAAAQRSAYPQTLLFYEVGAPLYPNLFVDITAVAALKWRAVGEFVSQLGMEAYDAHARAFASLRAFGLGPACAAAEAFFSVDASALKQNGAAAATPYWPLIRARHQLANSPQQMPLVSVLIRSVDRPQLVEAVASVAAQTYSNIELVLINASGREHGAIPYPAQHLALQLVEPPSVTQTGHSRNRAGAANLAIDAARGELALFLDDDDLIEPHHIERLVGALLSKSSAVGAYAGVRVEGPDGAFQRNYDLPWSRHRIQGINYLPIHAVVFRLDRARQAGVRFDEALPVLEDWDFWRKLASQGDLVHCPGVSAVYRQGYGESGLGDPDHDNHWKTWHRLLLERYVQNCGAAELAQTLAWHAIELDQVQVRLELFSIESQAALKAKQAQLERFSLESQAALHAKDEQLEQFSRQSQAALRAKDEQIERFSQESQAALRTTEERLEQFSVQSQVVLQSRDQQIAQQLAEISALTERLLQSQTELQRVRSALTWRVTAPLRRARAWLRSSRQ